jgi:hypothetical protein
MKAVIGVMGLAFVALLSLASCEDSGTSNPDPECLTDQDCGIGYICKYKECKKVIDVEDGDAVDGDIIDGDEPDGDLEPDVEPDLDGDEPDGDTDPEPDVDTETDGDEDWDGVCDESNLDPRCNGFFSQIYCRDGEVRHSVLECRSDAEGDRLYRCNLSLNCDYPDCGYVTSDSYFKACTQGCISNPDPEQDDYCAEDTPVDGDEEQIDGDTVDGDTVTDGDIDIPDHQDGAPCNEDADCLPSHRCRGDWDGSGKYCAKDSYTCVFHVGMDAEEPVLFYEQGDRICVGKTYKRCSTGQWVSPTTCPGDECVDAVAFQAQTCDNGEDGKSASCQPSPRVTYQCPGNLICLDGSNYCRNSCTLSEHCRLGYVCTSEQICVCGQAECK